jgi:hypothetical protein
MRSAPTSARDDVPGALVEDDAITVINADQLQVQ